MKSGREACERIAARIPRTNEVAVTDRAFRFLAAFAWTSCIAVLPLAAVAEPAAIVQATALIDASKFAEAKAAMQSYLVAHPRDASAETLLGVADVYLDDTQGAVAAFDLAGTIPKRYTVVASKAYADAAVDALKAKQTDLAVTLASKSLGLSSTVNALFIRGTAYANMQQYGPALADLETAKVRATAGKADAATLDAIDASLATSYIFGGQPAKGLALAGALKRRNPANTRVDDTLAAYYNQQALAAMRAGRTDEAVDLLERGARAVPARAVVLYVAAANTLAQADKPDWKLVKAEVDKALAIDAADARANFVAGIALANVLGTGSHDTAPAMAFLRKAKLNAGTDSTLNAEIDKAIAELSKR